MIAVSLNHTLCLVHEILVDRHSTTKPNAMIRPRRSFWLKIETETVSHAESSLWRAIGMESHGVQAIFLALTENPFPRSLIGWRIASFRKTAVTNSSTDVYRFSVENDIHTFCLYLPHSEGCTDRISIGIFDFKGIKVGVELIP